MKLWKALGLAGVAGVAATGVIIARDQRQRAQLSPEQIRGRLHERVEAAEDAGRDPGGQSVGSLGNPGGSTESSARA